MKKFLKILGVSLLSVAIVLSAVFLPLMLKKNSSYLSSSHAYSFDNETQTFYTDTYNLPIISLLNNPQSPDADPITPIDKTESLNVLLSFAFVYSPGSFEVAVNVEYSNYNLTFTNSTNGYFTFSRYTYRQSGSLPVETQLVNPVYFEKNNTITQFDTFLSSTKFNSNITRVIFNDYRNYNLLGADNLDYTEYITFTYYDDSSNYLTIFMPFNNFSSYPLSEYVFLGERYYFLNSSAQFTDNDYYNQGLSDGYSEGLTDGKSSGYSEGFEAGEISGYSNGYNQGVENANEYTFTALIGAVFDAPVTAFTSLFNFNILGFNVLSFITSLLTLCVVIFILKLVLGGK